MLARTDGQRILTDVFSAAEPLYSQTRHRDNMLRNTQKHHMGHKLS